MDFVMSCLSVGENGNLSIGGCDVAALAEEYGTPAYIMDEDQIRENCRVYNRAMQEYYGGNGIVLYASKGSFMQVYLQNDERGEHGYRRCFRR